MAGDTIVNGRAYAYDNYLADNIGPRLTGSENYTRAAAWTVHEFQSLGLSEVHTEEWTMPATWEPETAATGRILAPIDVQGVPSLVLWTAMDKYDLLHHKASDTFESVVQKDLTQDAAVVAITAYALVDSLQPFALHLSAAQVQEMFKSAGHLEEYDYLRTNGFFP